MASKLSAQQVDPLSKVKVNFARPTFKEVRIDTEVLNFSLTSLPVLNLQIEDETITAMKAISESCREFLEVQANIRLVS